MAQTLDYTVPDLAAHPLDRPLAAFAWAAWGIAFIVVLLMVVPDAWNHNECVPYAYASADWRAGQDMYNAPRYIHQPRDGFLYFPHAAIIYIPFEMMGGSLGHPWGDMAWRLAGLALYCGGIWRLAGLLCPNRQGWFFAVASAVAFFPTLASLRNGQANLHIAGFMLQATAALAQRRWRKAVLWLFLGLAIKPIIIVMMLLAAAIYRPLRWRMAAALVLFLLAPFAAQHFHYVWGEYLACYRKMAVSSQPKNPYCDLYGLIWYLGWRMPHQLLVAMQLAAAGGALALCFFLSRRWVEPWRSVFIFAVAAIYLVLLNPRTESNSYVMVIPAVGFLAAICLLDFRLGYWWALVVIAMCLWCDGYVYESTRLWLKQVACIAFTVLLVRHIVREGRPVGMGQNGTK